ncbi:putative ubiquitin carboxyl-terminal hydrolase 5 [Diplonema papillatum]|nr:putative ubiquitin carboxyl-terminal hydrolase 5 [Diplonema papillatum]
MSAGAACRILLRLAAEGSPLCLLRQIHSVPATHITQQSLWVHESYPIARDGLPIVWRWQLPIAGLLDTATRSPFFTQYGSTFSLYAQENLGALGLYVDCPILAQSQFPSNPSEWNVNVRFSFSMVQNTPIGSGLRFAEKTFDVNSSNWGCAFVISTDDLRFEKGYLHDGKITVEFSMFVFHAPHIQARVRKHLIDTARRETGCIGITRTPGAKESFLIAYYISMFHILPFRQLIFDIVDEAESGALDVDKRPAFFKSLASLFRHLEAGNQPVRLGSLALDHFLFSLPLLPAEEVDMQNVPQDAMYFELCLFMAVRGVVKGTRHERRLEKVFEGVVEYGLRFAENDAVDAKTTQQKFIHFDLDCGAIDSVCDGLLSVSDVHLSEFQAEQEAIIHRRIIQAPPVLILPMGTLRSVSGAHRFQKDCEVPASFTRQFGSENVEYWLMSLFVMDGSRSFGQTSVYVRLADGKWRHYADDIVRIVESDYVVSQYGRGEWWQNFTVGSYRAVYVRKEQYDDLISAPCYQTDSPLVVSKELPFAGRQATRLVRLCTYADIAVSDEKPHAGLYEFPEEPRLLEVPLEIRMDDFRKKIAELTGLGDDPFRLWRFLTRRNKTRRPSEFVPSTCKQLSDAIGSARCVDLLVEEVLLDVPDTGLALSKKLETGADGLVMLLVRVKSQKTVMFIGQLYLRPTDALRVLCERVDELISIPGLSLRLYEEIEGLQLKELLSLDATLAELGLTSGDIIICQDTSEETLLPYHLGVHKDALYFTELSKTSDFIAITPDETGSFKNMSYWDLLTKLRTYMPHLESDRVLLGLWTAGNATCETYVYPEEFDDLPVSKHIEHLRGETQHSTFVVDHTSIPARSFRGRNLRNISVSMLPESAGDGVSAHPTCLLRVLDVDTQWELHTLMQHVLKGIEAASPSMVGVLFAHIDGFVYHMTEFPQDETSTQYPRLTVQQALDKNYSLCVLSQEHSGGLGRIPCMLVKSIPWGASNSFRFHAYPFVLTIPPPHVTVGMYFKHMRWYVTSRGSMVSPRLDKADDLQPADGVFFHIFAISAEGEILAARRMTDPTLSVVKHIKSVTSSVANVQVWPAIGFSPPEKDTLAVVHTIFDEDTVQFRKHLFRSGATHAQPAREPITIIDHTSTLQASDPL